MKTAVEMFEAFKSLASEERKALFQLVRNALYPNAEVPLDSVMQELRDARFSKGFVCPHCESKTIKRHGFYNGWQRYKCKDCNKTFSDTTNTVITGTHYPEKWITYVECMLQGMSLRKIAEQLKIHVSTAFFWRHKILLALMREPSESLKGIIEADETYMLELLRGKNRVKKLGTRKARKRGGVSQYRGISREQVCILVAVDRNGETVSQVAGYGHISSAEIEGVFERFKSMGAKRMKQDILVRAFVHSNHVSIEYLRTI